MICKKCGAQLMNGAVTCDYCGCTLESERSWLVTLLLSWFLGGFGVHRFYTGYILIGVIQLLTMGGCGIWSMIDFICICFNKFEDVDTRELAGYNQTIGMIVFAIVAVLTLLAIGMNGLGMLAAIGGARS